MNNTVFRKTTENVGKHRDIKLVTTKSKKNCLVTEPNYHTTNCCFKKWVTHRNEKSIDTYE